MRIFGVSRELPFLNVPVLSKCSVSKRFSLGISRKYFQNPEEYSDINRSNFARNLERNSYLPNQYYLPSSCRALKLSQYQRSKNPSSSTIEQMVTGSKPTGSIPRIRFRVSSGRANSGYIRLMNFDFDRN